MIIEREIFIKGDYMEYKSNFKFFSRISSVEEVNGEIYLLGVASSTSIDDHKTIFSESCQRGWIEDFNSGKPTYLELFHDGIKDFTRRIGRVVEVWVEDNPNKVGIKDFWIKAKISKKNNNAKELLRIMQNPDTEFGEPRELGLSINGFLDPDDIEIIEVDGEEVIVYNRARLLLVGVTEYPSNPDSFNLSLTRSLDKEVLEKKILVMRGKKMSESVVTENVEEVVENVPEVVAEVVQEESVAEVVSEAVEKDALEVLRSEVNELKQLISELNSKLISREVQSEVVQESASELVVVEQENVTRDMLSEIKNELSSIKAENALLRSELKEVGNKPSSSPAQQIFDMNTIQKSVTREDILALARSGKLSQRSLQYVKEAQLKNLL